VVLFCYLYCLCLCFVFDLCFVLFFRFVLSFCFFVLFSTRTVYFRFVLFCKDRITSLYNKQTEDSKQKIKTKKTRKKYQKNTIPKNQSSSYDEHSKYKKRLPSCPFGKRASSQATHGKNRYYNRHQATQQTLAHQRRAVGKKPREKGTVKKHYPGGGTNTEKE